jgi:glycosyltransferase involved in cell wall biosynthesis
MIERRTAVFLLNLIQDVSVLRPLMIMAHRDFGFDVRILASAKFRSRDMFGIWEAELELLRRQIDARLVIYRTDLEAFRELEGSRGIIFSASESTVPEHDAAHALFQYAPPTYLKVTLQHGFECVGFQHSAAHDRTYGPTASFAADIICAWQPPGRLRSLTRSQEPKIEVTGPTAVLQQFGRDLALKPLGLGLVCENLHSVRLRSAAGSSDEFLASFREFSRFMDDQGRRVLLRPHPGGQFVLKNKTELPRNVDINNAPMYRLDLRSLDYGISAPSSVLIDLLLSDVPTAIWRDSRDAVDTSNYAGLTTVSDAGEWRDFAIEAAENPAPFVESQRRFLDEQQMPISPVEVFARYAKIFQAADRLAVRTGTVAVDRQRLLLVANAHLPTVQVCLERPLRPLIRSGELVMQLLTETRLLHKAKLFGSEAALAQWVSEALDAFGPDVVMFSRYSGPYSNLIVDWARRHAVPIVYQIDDDLLGVPRELGESKYAYHNDPDRIAAVHNLLGQADLVYASTDVLRDQLLRRIPALRVITGAINASGKVLRKPRAARARVIGYMASADHLPNLEMVLPAIIRLLDTHPQLSFELFGSIPQPSELDRFGERVRRIAPVPDYELFLDALTERAWDVGICPLVSTAFNRAKSNNKWVEYTSVGAAVVASAETVYDRCCADGCGVLAQGLDDWTSALDSLVRDDAERVAIVMRAQRKLQSDYGIAAHRQQILVVLECARERGRNNLVKENA